MPENDENQEGTGEVDTAAERTWVERQTRVARPGMLGEIAGEIAENLVRQRTAMDAAQERRLRELGGPQAYVQAVAPSFCTLFSGTITEKMALEHPEPMWAEIDSRAADCLKCPPNGGTCANKTKEGRRLVVRGEGVEFKPCERWKEHFIRERLARAGVPPSLVGIRIGDLLQRTPDGQYPLRDELKEWFDAIHMKQRPASLLLTGGKATHRTALLAAIIRAIAHYRLKLGYTFGPKLASELRAFYDNKSEEDPLEKCEEVDVLAFDFLDPVPESREPWAPWFLERVDTLLWKRLGDTKPTVMCSRHSLGDLMSHLHYSAIFPIVELKIDHPSFGPFLIG